MYNYLPNSAHEIFGFDLNYGFINTEYNDSKLSKSLHDYILYLEPQNVTDFVAFDYNNYYNAPYNIYTQNAGDVIRTVNGVTATLDLDIYSSINISNTMATNKVNEYVLLHLPSLPTMANKIASNNIVQNAYTKLHLGTGSTRNVFFGRIKAFTNVYMLKPSVKISRLHIKLTDYTKMKECKDKKAPWGAPISVDASKRKDSLFIKYGTHFQTMIKNVKDRETELIELLHRLFDFDLKNKVPIKIKGDLTEDKLNNEIMKDIQNVIKKMYIGCEMDFQRGIQIYNEIYKQRNNM